MFGQKKSPNIDADKIKAHDAEFDELVLEVIKEQVAIAEAEQAEKELKENKNE